MNPRWLFGVGDSVYDGGRDVTVCHCYHFKPKLRPPYTGMKIEVYEVEEDWKVRSKQTYSLDSFSSNHAIGISENYYVLNKCPMYVDVEKALDPNVKAGNTIGWDAEGIHEIHLVPRPPHDGEPSQAREARIYKLDEAAYPIHFVNAFEEEDNVIIDAIQYPKFPLTRSKEATKSYTCVLDEDKLPKWVRTVCSPDGKAESHTLSSRPIELPKINPLFRGLRYRYAYCIVGSHPSGALYPAALGKVDLETGYLETWTKGPQYSAGEPTFVPRNDPGAGEDDGWLLSFCLNLETEKTEFVIFDAKNIRDGPIATLYLDHTIGDGFHGIWINKYYGD